MRIPPVRLMCPQAKMLRADNLQLKPVKRLLPLSMQHLHGTLEVSSGHSCPWWAWLKRTKVFTRAARFGVHGNNCYACRTSSGVFCVYVLCDFSNADVFTSFSILDTSRLVSGSIGEFCLLASFDVCWQFLAVFRFPSMLWTSLRTADASVWLPEPSALSMESLTVTLS